jgi:hypothetical protein
MHWSRQIVMFGVFGFILWYGSDLVSTISERYEDACYERDCRSIHSQTYLLTWLVLVAAVEAAALVYTTRPK